MMFSASNIYMTFDPIYNINIEQLYKNRNHIRIKLFSQNALNIHMNK